ncbi:hypothetical protein [Flammeovirga sp. SJP92]|uniref:hypothetical protein n=1 Tax=Flammeovirga sp. SJP92 TaxID=1775430 RepID=UPI0007870296|nr:hypothetical protein [Flammeovirga sp. SJP92]KXX69898.1 hypothetical protein AVL50_13530 [Flammeovirga sp. SJP92]
MNTKSILSLILVAVLAFFSCSNDNEVTPASPQTSVYQRTNLDQDFKCEIMLSSDGKFELRTSKNEFAKGDYSKAAKIKPNEPQDYVLHYKMIKKDCDSDWEDENIDQLMEFEFYDEINAFTVEECK